MSEDHFNTSSVTGDFHNVKTWTYVPSMSVTVSPSRGIRIAARLLWDSLVALARRDTVTFEVGTSAPYTIDGEGRS